MEVQPGVDLLIVDEVGKMECLSARFVQAMERLWEAPLALLVTVGEKGGGLMQRLRKKPEALLINVTPANRDALPDRILQLLASA